MWLTKAMRYAALVIMGLSLIGSASTCVAMLGYEGAQLASFYAPTLFLVLPLSAILYQLCCLRETG